MKKILLFLILGMFCINLVSSASFDNIKSFDKDVGDYGKVEIKDWFGLQKLTQLELKKNTDTCGTSCSAETEIVMYQRGSLIDDVRFMTLMGEDWKEQSIRSYQFYIKTNEEEYDVDDYEYQCKEREVYIQENETTVTEKYDCENVKVGTHKENRKLWEEYNLGDEVEIGTYEIKLEGEKKPSRTVDWQITSQGKLIDEWAVWGSSDLATDLIAWIPLDDGTGDNMADNHTLNNSMWKSGTGSWKGDGVNGDSWTFGGATTDILVNNNSIAGFPSGDVNHNVSLSLWMYITTGENNNNNYFTFSDISNAIQLGMSKESTNNYYISYTGSDHFVTPAEWVQTASTWMHLVISYNTNGTITVYTDGSLISTGNIGEPTFDMRIFKLGQGVGFGGVGFRGSMDEVGIWNRPLQQSDVDLLYNSGSGVSYSSFLEGDITLNSPEDDYTSTTNSVDFNCSATVVGGVTLTNISLWHNGTGTWERNQTLVRTGTSNESVFTTTITDPTLWTCSACDSDGDCGFATTNRTISVDSTDPEVNITYPFGAVIYHKNGDNLSLNWTVSDAGTLGTCWYEYQGVNTTVTCADLNLSFLVNDFNNKTINFYVNDSVGNQANSSSTWTYNAFENSRTFNTTSYETATESYTINLSTDSTITSVNLLFNGTSYETTNSGELWTKSLTQPLNIYGTKEINWSITSGSTYVTNASHQVISNTLFGLCNASLTSKFINFTFKDEADDSSIVASIPTSTFNYWLGDGSVNKTLTYINNTANPSYVFCSIPSDKSLNVDMVVQYKNTTSYPQRTYDPGVQTLTNITTNKTLYLLNTVDGLYVTFQVLNAAQQPISGVSVNATRVIGSENVVVGDGTTGASGSVTFWLNPDFEHTFSFLKTGYDIYTYSGTPTQSTYTITLGGGTTTETDYRRGISLSSAPISRYLDNGTDYDFNFTISSSYWSLDSYEFDLYYSNNSLIGTASGSESAGSTISLTNINTYNSTSIYMYYNYVINSTIINGTSYWIIDSTTGRDFSLFHFFEDLNLYMDAGLFGIDDFGKAILCLAILIFVAGGISYRYGIQSEAAVMGILFGVVLFLDIGIGLIPTPTIFGITPKENLVTIIAGAILLGTLIREELR